jgi:hypothetical protein
MVDPLLDLLKGDELRSYVVLLKVDEEENEWGGGRSPESIKYFR